MLNDPVKSSRDTEKKKFQDNKFKKENECQAPGPIPAPSSEINDVIFFKNRKEKQQVRPQVPENQVVVFNMLAAIYAQFLGIFRFIQQLLDPKSRALDGMGQYSGILVSDLQ